MLQKKQHLQSLEEHTCMSCIHSSTMVPLISAWELQGYLVLIFFPNLSTGVHPYSNWFGRHFTTIIQYVFGESVQFTSQEKKHWKMNKNTMRLRFY